MEEKKSFLGKGWAFPPTFNLESGSVKMVEGDEDIKESIQIIINTIPGERMMLPEFGCSIREYIFETNDATYMSMLKDAIYDALLYHEPRIKDIAIEIEQNDINIQPQKGSIVHIQIAYTVIITNTRSNMVYPFYIDEGTNL